MKTLRRKSSLVAGLILALFSLATGAEKLKTQPVPDEVWLAIDSNTKMAMASFTKLSGFNFDYSEKSIEWLNGFIERNATEDPGTLVDVVGSYYGEAIAQTYKGKWVLLDGAPVIELRDDFVVFPLSKVEKHFINGSEDSVLLFYKAIPELLAKWGAENASNQ